MKVKHHVCSGQAGVGPPDGPDGALLIQLRTVQKDGLNNLRGDRRVGPLKANRLGVRYPWTVHEIGAQAFRCVNALLNQQVIIRLNDGKVGFCEVQLNITHLRTPAAAVTSLLLF